MSTELYRDDQIAITRFQWRSGASIQISELQAEYPRHGAYVRLDLEQCRRVFDALRNYIAWMEEDDGKARTCTEAEKVS